MKKHLVILMLILTCYFFAVTSDASVQYSKSNGYISVTSNAQKEVDPTLAQITFTVESTNISAATASNENKMIINQVITALKSNLNLNNGDEIKTSDFSVRPNYSYSNENKKSLDNYTVTNSINVKTRKISNVGNLIDIAIKNGANRLDTLSFDLDNEKNICNDLFPQVVKDAQSQASIIARALNLSVVGLKSLNASCNVYGNRMQYGAVYVKAALGDSSSYQTPIEAGKIKVNATVNADFNVQ